MFEEKINDALALLSRGVVALERIANAVDGVRRHVDEPPAPPETTPAPALGGIQPVPGALEALKIEMERAERGETTQPVRGPLDSVREDPQQQPATRGPLDPVQPQAQWPNR